MTVDLKNIISRLRKKTNAAEIRKNISRNPHEDFKKLEEISRRGIGMNDHLFPLMSSKAVDTLLANNMTSNDVSWQEPELLKNDEGKPFWVVRINGGSDNKSGYCFCVSPFEESVGREKITFLPESNLELKPVDANDKFENWTNKEFVSVEKEELDSDAMANHTTVYNVSVNSYSPSQKRFYSIGKREIARHEYVDSVGYRAFKVTKRGDLQEAKVNFSANNRREASK